MAVSDKECCGESGRVTESQGGLRRGHRGSYKVVEGQRVMEGQGGSWRITESHARLRRVTEGQGGWETVSENQLRGVKGCDGKGL